ncbi:MAG: class I SAM-dependent methyltransferase [Alphaproteobacteria bacterium]|nr:class I SAM-dependent methyltransferase [Alphaproteobacteria bacterium]TAD88603.1 MAG: class I SAM-dependent methyltransferase [Alphaproteobacteria bacterium]
MTDQATAVTGFTTAVDAAWGDPAVWTAHGQQWTHLDRVRQTINRRVTGDPHVAPLTWFFRAVDQEHGLPLTRVLVLGCGSMGIETEIALAGWAQDIIAIDLSPRALAIAAAKSQAAGLTSVTHMQADMNALPLGAHGFEPGSFDAIISISGVHHCANLEGLYAACAKLLKPQGWFYLDEFVGPSRFQWPEVQVGLINGFLAALPEAYLRTAHGHIRRGYLRPTVDQVIAVDPSEAVRSTDLLPLLSLWFSVHVVRGYGGNLLHLALAEIAQNFHTDQDGYLERLIDLEGWCLAERLLVDDFAVIMARNR